MPRLIDGDLTWTVQNSTVDGTIGGISDAAWTILSEETTEDIVSAIGAAPSGAAIRPISFCIDGGGVEITTGFKAYAIIPYNCTILGVTMIGKPSGSIVMNILKSDYTTFPTTASIVASAPPTISGAQKSQDVTLTGWTKTINSGDILELQVTSVSDIVWANISIYVTVT